MAANISSPMVSRCCNADRSLSCNCVNGKEQFCSCSILGKISGADSSIDIKELSMALASIA